MKKRILAMLLALSMALALAACGGNNGNGNDKPADNSTNGDTQPPQAARASAMDKASRDRKSVV